MANIFRNNNMLIFTIDIYNEECAVRVKEVKISIKRIVTFSKELLLLAKEEKNIKNVQLF